MADSTIKGGPGGSGDLHAAKKKGKNWAELPAKERDRILQSQTEGFPAHYQEVLKRYYRRLAEENSSTEDAKGTDDDSTADSTASDEDVDSDKPASAKAAPEAKKSEADESAGADSDKDST